MKSTTETQNSKQSDTKQTDAPISKSKVDSVSQIEDSSNHPDTIGDYQILADLGSGGQGSVYRARRMSDGVEVALKTIYNDRYMFDQVALVRNLGVRSPNLAKVLDFDFKSNPPFVVMEFFSSPNLSAHMREFQEQCDAPQVWKSYFLNVAFGVGSALSEMHKNGIVHRDVRIPNIVFRDFDPEQTLQTGHVTPVLIDYGLSAKVGLSPLQNFAGVARCMAPELFTPERFDQARNVLVSPTLDVRQDIYSFGVMLFQMLTSQLPYPDMPPSNRFSFQSMHDIHVFLKHQAVPDPREYNFMIPDSLAEIIMKCMQHDPNQRYQSINDVMRDLSVVAKKSGLGHLAKITL